MAETAVAKKSCVKCLKSLGQVTCGGCERWFCVKHLLEHRQELNQQMDTLTLEHDQLQQYLSTESDASQKHPLLTRVDQWELQSIERIKQVANEVRSQLMESLAQATRNTRDSLHQITAELQENRQAESFTEIELNKWMNQLKALRETLEKPSTIELIDGENEKSSTHIPLIHLRTIRPSRVPSQITDKTRWSTNGRTVAGDHGCGDALNQFHLPYGLDIDDDGSLVIGDARNHRIIKWKPNAAQGETIATGIGDRACRTYPLMQPTTILIDRVNGCLIVSEWGNRRVTRLPLNQQRQNGGEGEVIISDTLSVGLAMDDEGSLYVSDIEKQHVRRYGRGDESDGVVVAGSNGKGAALNQLDGPRQIVVDADRSVYVSDAGNHRVMKWMRDAKEGVPVAGGKGRGNSLAQLSDPSDIFVDRMGSVYIVDKGNQRVMRWVKGAKEGEVIVGGNGEGAQCNQFHEPSCMSVDNRGNLYVVDRYNNRVQCFERNVQRRYV